jgi:hypothetical protein
MLFANPSAIITDAFPSNQRGLASGINGVAANAGTRHGRPAGSRRLAARVPRLGAVRATQSVPAYTGVHDLGERRPAKIDWLGNSTFAVGLIAVMVGITYGIKPYGHHAMGWTSPTVLAALISGIGVLGTFMVIEARVEQPMFDLGLFRIRPGSTCSR